MHLEYTFVRKPESGNSGVPSCQLCSGQSSTPEQLKFQLEIDGYGDVSFCPRCGQKLKSHRKCTEFLGDPTKDDLVTVEKALPDIFMRNHPWCFGRWLILTGILCCWASWHLGESLHLHWICAGFFFITYILTVMEHKKDLDLIEGLKSGDFKTAQGKIDDVVYGADHFFDLELYGVVGESSDANIIFDLPEDIFEKIPEDDMSFMLISSQNKLYILLRLLDGSVAFVHKLSLR